MLRQWTDRWCSKKINRLPEVVMTKILFAFSESFISRINKFLPHYESHLWVGVLWLSLKKIVCRSGKRSCEEEKLKVVVFVDDSLPYLQQLEEVRQLVGDVNQLKKQVMDQHKFESDITDIKKVLKNYKNNNNVNNHINNQYNSLNFWKKNDHLNFLWNQLFSVELEKLFLNEHHQCCFS